MLGARAQPDAGSSRRCGWARPAGAGPEDFLAEHYDLNHGSAEVPERLMAGLVRRRQQIGQLEILAAIVPYLSMPATLAGRDVVHWIDDEGGAGARLFRGAGQLADGARAACVQPGPAREAVVRVRALEGQPADEPSRVDLSRLRWRVLACPELVSEPVPVSWPQEDNWRDPAGWARLAAGRAAAATGW